MQKVDSRKITLIVLFILILGAFALLISKFTFAFLGPDIDEDQNVQGEVTTMGDTLIFSKGNNLSLSASTDNFNSASGNLTDTTNPSVKLIANTKSGSATAVYYSGILINENTYTYSKSDNTAELILTVRDETGAIITSAPGLTYVTVNGVSGFDITGKTGAFNIVSEREISTTSTTTGITQTWTYTITFINFGTEQDQSVNENANLDAVVALNQKEISYVTLCEKGTLACEIANKYTTQGANNLYYHNSSLTNGAGDNSYRYAGPFETTNNWVCFGTDNATCDDEHLYRIIGIFGGKAKLIKAYEGTETSLGVATSTSAAHFSKDFYKGKLTTSPGYAWSATNTNDWSTSSLNINILNGAYLRKLGTKWNEMISNNNWIVGGNTYQNLVYKNTKVAFQNEIKSPARTVLPTYKAKVGLMYLSDYGYATSPNVNSWTKAFKDYYNANVRPNNWLVLGVNEWLITRLSDSEINAVILAYGSDVIYETHALNYSTNKAYLIVRPTFYLNSDVKLTGGTGTETAPYRIA